MQPLKIKLINDNKLLILWDDNSETILSLNKLRGMCPCATCTTNRLNQSSSYIPIFLSNQLEVTGIETIGNYAFKIDWKDGHNTGIYEYKSLNKYTADSNRVEL
ncbi:MAG: DUF971 domain-containing protein [Ignavibacteria bacterium]|jgi:DUF971 family protein